MKRPHLGFVYFFNVRDFSDEVDLVGIVDLRRFCEETTCEASLIASLESQFGQSESS